MKINKKIIFIFIFLNIKILKPADFTANVFAKFLIFYSSQFVSTLSHEFGHAFVSKLRNFSPKIVIGKNITERGEYKDFLTIDNSLNPNIGSTMNDKSKCKEDQETKLNRDMIQKFMGPCFGIVSRIIQLYILDIIKDDISYDLYNSVKNFISAKLIAQVVYGLTPFDQLLKGDGSKLFNMLNIKFKMYTSFFDKSRSFQGAFTLLKNYGFYFYISYVSVKLILKLFQSKTALNLIEKNKYLSAIFSYIKGQKISENIISTQDEAVNFLEDPKKKEKAKELTWVNELIQFCIFY